MKKHNFKELDYIYEAEFELNFCPNHLLKTSLTTLCGNMLIFKPFTKFSFTTYATNSDLFYKFEDYCVKYDSFKNLTNNIFGNKPL